MKPPHPVYPASDSDTSLAESERKATPHRCIPKVCLSGEDSALQYHLATDTSDKEIGRVPCQMEGRATYTSSTRSRGLSPIRSPAHSSPHLSDSDSDEEGGVSLEGYLEAYN